jgi:hypothetical protein
MKKLLTFSALAVLALACMAAATRRAVTLEGNTMLQSGTAVTTSDCTVTQTFSTAFSAAPKVVCPQIGLDTTTTNVVAITSSNFVLRTGKASTTNHWIAIGTP